MKLNESQPERTPAVELAPPPSRTLRNVLLVAAFPLAVLGIAGALAFLLSMLQSDSKGRSTSNSRRVRVYDEKLGGYVMMEKGRDGQWFEPPFSSPKDGSLLQLYKILIWGGIWALGFGIVVGVILFFANRSS